MNKMIAGRYMLVTSLGEGGMADVYLAIDTILNREVAIKILRGELSNDPVTLLRFQREANAVSKLNHPNVVEVYDVGEFEGKHYIVMEYIRGRTLKQLISQRGALHKEEALNIMIQLTNAVEHAHENNIIHRDIKPQNVLIKDDGTVKITDFGIALAHDAVQLTQSDAVLGSAHYLAPETTRGEVPTNQIDIYALGIVFYELLTGNVPFRGDNPVQIAMKHLREEVPSVRDFNPTLPQSIENIISKATVKNRKQRYLSAREMLDDLETCLLPEFANVKKLVFEEEHPQPTVVLKHKNDTKRTTQRKEKVIPLDDEPIINEKKNKSMTKIVVVLITLICVLATAGILYLSGIFKTEKAFVVPDVTNVTKEEAVQLLKEAGFETSSVKYVEGLSDDIESGKVIGVSPASGSSAKRGSPFELTVSKGIYFVVEDYTKMLLTDIEKELKEKNPNLTLEIEYQYSSDLKSGYIIKQSGLNVGDKLDPNEKKTLHVVVTAWPQMKITDFVGRNVDELIKELEKKGIMAVRQRLSTDEMSEEEIAALEKNVVVKTDPVEGTDYIQKGEDTYITLYYYQE